MAIFSLIIGGFFGMISGFLALIVFNTTMLMALLMWTGVGTATGLIILAIVMIPPREKSMVLIAEIV
jgi:hypothetical protein